MCYRHLNNFDAGDASFRGEPCWSADIRIDELQWRCLSGTAAPAASRTPGGSGSPTTLSKNVQSTPTLSRNSNRGRGSPKVQRPDQLHSKIKLQPEESRVNMICVVFISLPLLCHLSPSLLFILYRGQQNQISFIADAS